MTDVQDGNLHLYTVSLDGNAMRFLIIKKPNGFGVALDACRICGAEGYRQDGQNVVCRHCGSAIYVPSIGDQGGCNPIAVASHTDGGDLVLDVSALAQATKRLRLGTLVTGIHYRHPAVLANMAAALDVISDGRLELGIGAGWNEEESGAYGIELGSVKERFDRFEEACQVLTSLLSEPTTNFDGKYYQLKDARNEPKGPQRPHPPICIGGSGEKRTLRITARYAQHWNFVGGPPDVFAHKLEVLASHCADIGRDPKEITTSAHLRLEPDLDYAKVIDDAAALAAEGLDLGIVYIPPPHDPAVLEPLAEAIRESGLSG